MNHPIAQVVALTGHANAFLQGRRVPRFFPANPTCTFCDWIRFFGVAKPLVGWRAISARKAMVPTATKKGGQGTLLKSEQISQAKGGDPDG